MSGEELRAEYEAEQQRKKDEEEEILRRAAATWDATIDKDWHSIEMAPPEFRENRDCIMRVITDQYDRGGGLVVMFVGGEMRKDKELFLEASEMSYGEAMQYAHDKIRGDAHYMLDAVRRSPHVLKYALTALVKNREFCLRTVTVNWQCLAYVDEPFKNDKAMVRKACEQNGNALRMASEDQRKDKKTVLIAVEQTWKAIKHVLDEPLHDQEIALICVKQHWHAFPCLPEDMRSDKEVALEALRQSPHAHRHLAGDLRKNVELAVLAFSVDGNVLEHAIDKIKNKKDAVIKAVMQSGKALQFASKELRQDRDVCYAAVSQDWSAMQFVDRSFAGDIEMLNTGCKQDGHCLAYGSEGAKAHPGLVKTALDEKWISLTHAVTPLEVLYSKKVDSKPSRLFWLGLTEHFPRPRIPHPVQPPAVSAVHRNPVVTFGDGLKMAEKQRQHENLKPKKTDGAVKDQMKGEKKKKKEKKTEKEETEPKKESEPSPSAAEPSPSAAWQAGQDLKAAVES